VKGEKKKGGGKIFRDHKLVRASNLPRPEKGDQGISNSNNLQVTPECIEGRIHLLGRLGQLNKQSGKGRRELRKRGKNDHEEKLKCSQLKNQTEHPGVSRGQT